MKLKFNSIYFKIVYSLVLTSHLALANAADSKAGEEEARNTRTATVTGALPAGEESIEGHMPTTSIAAQVINDKIKSAARDQSAVGKKPSFCDPINVEVTTAPPSKAINAIMPLCKVLVDADKSCQMIFSGDYGVNRICHTENNESITSSITLIQTLMSVASGVTNACSNFGKAMDIAKKAMTLYTTACTVAQVACSSKCGGAFTALQNFIAKSTAAVDAMATECNVQKAELIKSANVLQASGDPTWPAKKAEAVNLDRECVKIKTQVAAAVAYVKLDSTPASLPGIASKAEICKTSIPTLLGTAIINLGALAQGKAQSDQCKKDAEAATAQKVAQDSCSNVANKDRADCSCTIAANKTLSYCVTDVVDCGVAANADKPMCICKANPRMTGCEGVSTALATNSTLGSGGTSGLNSARGPSGNIINAPTAATNAGSFPAALKSSGTDGGGSSASASGGGSGGSLGGLTAGPSGSADKASGSNGLSKESLSVGGGFDSGGGGGGYRGSSYSSPEYQGKLRAFAAKNNIGAKIAGTGWTEQVTNGGGRSNFDKVRARYQENSATLLGK